MDLKLYSNPNLWNAKIAQCKDGSIFHTFEWGELMKVLPNVEFSAIEITDGCFVLLFKQLNEFYTSIIGYGGFCTFPTCNINYMDALKLLQEKTGYTMVRSHMGSACDLNKIKNSLDSKYELRERRTQILALQNSHDDFWHSIKGKARTGVKYARKNGVVIKEITSKQLENMHLMYLSFIEKLDISYTLPIDFFILLQKKLPKNSLLLGAYMDGLLVGFNVYVYDAKFFYFLLSVQNDLAKKTQAGYALMNAGVEIAINLRIKYLDLGYSHNEKIVKFKELWGAGFSSTYFLHFNTPNMHKGEC